MNRQKEWEALLSSAPPPELAGTVQKARARFKKHRIARAVLVPLGSLLTVVFLFAAMVNLSPAFAKAMEDLPFLGSMSRIFHLSKSLSVAGENGYMHHLNFMETKNGVTLTINDITVDQSAIVMTHDIQTDFPHEHNPFLHIVSIDGLKIDERGYRGWMYDSIQLLDVKELPQTLNMHLSISCDNPDCDFVPTDFDVSVPLAPFSNTQPRIMQHDRWVTADDMRVKCSRVELMPLMTLLRLSPDSGSDAAVKAVLLDPDWGAGREIAMDVKWMAYPLDLNSGLPLRLKSVYFDQSPPPMRLHGFFVLDADAPRMKIDLIQNTAEHLPEGFRFLGADRDEEKLTLRFESTAPWILTNLGPWFIPTEYYLQADKKDTSIPYFQEWHGSFYHNPDTRTLQFSYIYYVLPDSDMIYIDPPYTRIVLLDEPVDLPLS